MSTHIALFYSKNQQRTDKDQTVFNFNAIFRTETALYIYYICCVRFGIENFSQLIFLCSEFIFSISIFLRGWFKLLEHNIRRKIISLVHRKSVCLRFGKKCTIEPKKICKMIFRSNKNFIISRGLNQPSKKILIKNINSQHRKIGRKVFIPNRAQHIYNMISNLSKIKQKTKISGTYARYWKCIQCPIFN